jgi:hypothetical protein
MEGHISNLCIETSFVYDFSSNGEIREINYVNPSETVRKLGLKEAVFLFTEGNRVYYKEEFINQGVAVIVDSNSMVVGIVNRSSDPNAEPSFLESTDITVPPGGFVVLAIDEDYQRTGSRKFFSMNFKIGDLVKLKIKDIHVTLQEVLYLCESDGLAPLIAMNHEEFITTFDQYMTVKGTVLFANNQSDRIIIRKYNSKNCLSAEKVTNICSSQDLSSFSAEVDLEEGVNYIDILLSTDGRTVEATKKNLIIYRKAKTDENNKRIIMWVEEYVNAEALNSLDKMEKMIIQASTAGVTDFAVDVKGCEGYAAYQKATLSHTPYMTQSCNPRKQITMEFDFLEEFIRLSHQYGIKVLASFNFFAEGVISTGDYAMKVPELHKDWAEVLQAPEDDGELKSVLDTKREAMILYVNPANEEVQELQLKRAEEVLMNYDIDAIIMDRTRYDNQYADFSTESRIRFEGFLKERNKTLGHWPEDVYAIQKDGSMKQGIYYYDWITFRSMIIRDFSTRLKILVQQYRKEKKKDIQLAAYVGAWYEAYYQNGVNWASKEFRYNSRLNFPMPALYTEEYSKASYLDNIDFLMIGCYYDTKEQVGKYVTLGNILTGSKVPLLGSISLPSFKDYNALKEGFQEAYRFSDGAMIFDLCYTDWNLLKAAIAEK